MTDDLSPIPALDQLATALVAAQAEMPTVPKSHSATVKTDKGSYSYTYAGLADVTEAVLPILTKHGLSFTALPGNGTLTGMLLHTSGQSLAATLPITGGTPQSLGSSITYMRRYLLGCMTGLVTDDDDDGQTAQAERPVVRAKTQPTVETSPESPALRTDDQSRKLWTLAGKIWGADKDVTAAALRAWLGEGLGREVESTKTLTRTEAAEAITHLSDMEPADGSLIPDGAL